MSGERRPTARQRVHAELRRRIIALEMPPTAPISEQELARELGVSRTPVHEAVLLLREEGLVEAYPQQGTFVAHVDADRVRLAQFVREAIECAALTGIETADLGPGELTDLHANLAAQRQAAQADDVDRFLALDDDFHRLLLALGRRETAWPIVHQAKSHLDRARRYGLALHPLGHLIAQHTAVVTALAADDRDTAVGLLRDHLRVILADLKSIRELDPALFADDHKPAAAGAG